MSRHDLYRAPLDASIPEIRLLELTRDDDVVACKLHTGTSISELRFTALSYVWGDPDDTADIEVDGIQLPVSRNLASALKHVQRHLQHEFPDRDQAAFIIWADAVCINQANSAERTEQVRLMRGIFSLAKLVLGWLGAEDHEQTLLAFETLKILGNAFQSADCDVKKLMNLRWMDM